jgi:hypothetical protein
MLGHRDDRARVALQNHSPELRQTIYLNSVQFNEVLEALKTPHPLCTGRVVPYNIGTVRIQDWR